MSVLVELHNTGDATIRTEVQVIVEHVLSDRPGEWRVSIVGSRAKEDWEMKVEGPLIETVARDMQMKIQQTPHPSSFGFGDAPRKVSL
jgi:hypothetical protein